MNAVYFLLPAAILMGATFAFLFLRAVKSGQFDDLEGPAHRILMDDDDPRPAPPPDPHSPKQDKDRG